MIYNKFIIKYPNYYKNSLRLTAAGRSPIRTDVGGTGTCACGKGTARGRGAGGCGCTAGGRGGEGARIGTC